MQKRSYSFLCTLTVWGAGRFVVRQFIRSLKPSSDKEAEELAARENKADVIAGVDLSDKDPILSGILIDLSQRAAKNDGKQFAVMVAESLTSVTPMLDPPHRSAGFRVF
ncbi:MAG: hypothetical protein R3E60_06320 [Alphaproteobacteria bacterium]